MTDIRLKISFFVIVVLCFLYVLLSSNVNDENLNFDSLLNVTNPHNYTFITNPKYAVCGRQSDVLYIVFVVMSPDDFVRRERIRATWGDKKLFSNVKVIFSLALSTDEVTNRMITSENTVHQDIIQEDFIDSYKNLTLKIIMSFKWVKTYCPQAQYVIRVNHHIVVNTYAMVKFLELQRDKYKRTRNYFMGFVLELTGPVRNPNDKFYVSEEQFKAGPYDPYMEGSAFILTGDAVNAFYHKSLTLYWPPFSLWLDDVYMGMLAKRCNTSLLDIVHYFIPYHQNLDCSKENIFRILKNQTAQSTLFIISGDDPRIYWDELKKGINSSLEFKEFAKPK